LKSKDKQRLQEWKRTHNAELSSAAINGYSSFTSDCGVNIAKEGRVEESYCSSTGGRCEHATQNIHLSGLSPGVRRHWISAGTWGKKGRKRPIRKKELKKEKPFLTEQTMERGEKRRKAHRGLARNWPSRHHLTHVAKTSARDSPCMNGNRDNRGRGLKKGEKKQG